VVLSRSSILLVHPADGAPRAGARILVGKSSPLPELDPATVQRRNCIGERTRIVASALR